MRKCISGKVTIGSVGQMKKIRKKLHVSVVAEVYSDWWGAWQEIREIGKMLPVELCGHEIHGFIHRAL